MDEKKKEKAVKKMTDFMKKMYREYGISMHIIGVTIEEGKAETIIPKFIIDDMPVYLYELKSLVDSMHAIASNVNNVKETKHFVVHQHETEFNDKQRNTPPNDEK